MKRVEIMKIVEDSIKTETEYEGLIEDSMSARDIDGWDSLAHVRIMFRIDHHLGTQIELDSTYATKTIGDLIDLFVRELE